MFDVEGNHAIEAIKFVFNTDWVRREIELEAFNKKNPMPLMNSAETNLLEKYISKVKTVFEFGCGGRTLYISSKKNIKKIYSVESDKEWIKHVKDGLPKKAKVFYVDINADSSNHGHPKNDEKIDEWPKYSAFLKSRRNYFPDLILVDGRFRVACCLQSIGKMKKDSYLLVHDFDTKVRSYGAIEKYFDRIDQADSLHVFRKKENIQQKQLRKDLKKYLYLSD